MKKIALMTVLAVALALPGCLAIGAGGRIHRPPTIGREFIDLKKAHDSGAISDKEYARHKAKLKSSHPCRHHK